MPLIHQMTLQMIIEHLSRIASHSAQNKMDAKVCFNGMTFLWANTKIVGCNRTWLLSLEKLFLEKMIFQKMGI
jgi:hypothetical protein